MTKAIPRISLRRNRRTGSRRNRRISSRKRLSELVIGVIYVQATFNNTIVTVTDGGGQVLSCLSSGIFGFKARRKATPFAAQTVTQNALRTARDQGLKQAIVRIKGAGPGRDGALRAIHYDRRIKLKSIEDVTPLPHNGCRPPKKRRV
uniref:Small ribosomal subunit protein uS11c n=1 Tax=Incarvillea sinensis TaxID=291312 RepID=A0A866W014_9LAMI|nr:ribosomal protein S11 [Incarvillea sinensis]QOE76743.1 ribosomal protein S11 [Incarvillea sinensis]